MENKTLRKSKGFHKPRCKEVNRERFACWHFQHSQKNHTGRRKSAFEAAKITVHWSRSESQSEDEAQ